MAEDWAADVRKFVPDADEGVIAGIVRYCGIALQKRDSSLVSFSDPVETGRVRDNFLKKKLGLTQADEVLDHAIAAVGERMKGVNFKNRVTVYYLLLEHFGLLHLFGKAGAGGAAVAGAAAGVAGLTAAGMTAIPDGPDRGTAAPTPVPVAPVETPTAPQGLTGGYAAGGTTSGKTGMGLWPWVLLGLLLLALLWWLFFRTPNAPTVTATAPAGGEIAATVPAPGPPATDGLGALMAAPAEGAAAIPTGAGVTAETRDGKPVVKVYFDTGKTDLAPAFVDTATGLKDYLASHAGSTLAISGFNDSTGNAAANAELSKNRAIAVRSALVAAGIPEAAVALVKPAASTDTSTSNAAARRVEVVVR